MRRQPEPAEAPAEATADVPAPADVAPEGVTDADFFGADDAQTVLNQLRGLWDGLLRLVDNLVIALIVIVVAALLARLAVRLAKAFARRARLRPSLVSLLGQLAYLGVWIVGLLVAVTVIFPSITPAKLIAGLGIGSIAVGFAFKDIAENFIAGVLILWRFPVEIGDYIEVDGIAGTIEEITIRQTQLRQVDGDLVVIPNATLFKNPVNNYTNWPDRRTTVICGVAYGEDVGQARRVITEAVEGCQSVRRDGRHKRPIEVFAQEFADSSINFEVTWWTGSRPVDIRRSRDEVVEAVKRGLDEAGIEIPFPYRTLTFKEPLGLSRVSEANGDGQGT